MMMMMIIIIIIITRHKLYLDIPATASSNGPFQTSSKSSSFFCSIIQHYFLHPIVDHSCY